MFKILSLAIAASAMTFSAVQAAPVTYATNLSGSAEFPPNASPGSGFAQTVYDSVLHSLMIDVTFDGLLGLTTAAHIHCCTLTPGQMNAGVASTTPNFLGFPLGVSSGSYANTLDLTLASSWNPAFITNNGGTTASAEAALAAGLSTGRAYFNIHSNVFPGGEIRGFLQQVPEPASWALVALSIAALGAARPSRNGRSMQS